MPHNHRSTESARPMTEKLSERVERLEGPDREMDGEIARKIFGAGGDGLEGTVLYSKPGVSGWSHAIHYTASLDAAMSLVPEGYSWILYSDGSCEVGPTPIAGSMMDAEFTADAETPAIALCAAALKSRGL